MMKQDADITGEGKSGRKAMTDAITGTGAGPEGKKRFLLLVDGNARDLFFTGMVLQRLGYDVYVSGRAEEALGIMKNALPMLVIADVLLPGMSGVELLKRIKKEPKTAAVPMILQTSVADPRIEELCLAYGCASFFRKPVDPQGLYYAIQHASETTPRSYVRLKTFLRAGVAGGTGEPEVITALSENGFYVRTLSPRPVRSVHETEFAIEGVVIKTRAEVLYSFSMNKGPFKEPGMGMKFLAIADADRQRIKSFIKGQITKDLQAP